MRQVVVSVRTGRVSALEVPEPLVRPGHLLIANAASLISAGTEKMTVDVARKSLLGKARERPDQLRRLLVKLKQEGLMSTVEQVRARLDEPVPMGYSSAGVVLACGDGVQEFKPGQRVASNGSHAGVVCVPKNLCALVPDGVPSEHAAFAVLGAIALQGVRLSRVGLGDTAFVIGLGLVGQITVALLRAAGCRVIGTDPISEKCDLAMRMGAWRAAPGLSSGDVAGMTGGTGADAVLITAATTSNAPAELAAEAVRQKGRIVAVGAVGLNMPRRPLYFKEAELVVSCSYGAGRYDPEYEQRGHDYPIGHVRWTEQRNIRAVLEMMAAGSLDVSPLISHRFPVDRPDEAYTIIHEGRQPYMGLVLQYPDIAPSQVSPHVYSVRPSGGTVGVGFVGVGSFARSVLLPAVRKTPLFRPQVVCSASGLSAGRLAEGLGFPRATANEDEVWADRDVRVVFIATRHGVHARQVVSALSAGKHVFVEKPLALTVDEVLEVEDALRSSQAAGSLLMVGFNRRFSPAAREVKRFFVGVAAPLTVSIRMNVGTLPPEHWAQDEREGGGRIIGEACHAIDLATFLVGAPPVRVFAESIGGPQAPRITDDQAFVTLRHANGSVSSIAYLAGGDKAFPKERIEVLGGGRLAVINDFREVTTSFDGKLSTKRSQQDKGHRAEIAAFAEAVERGCQPPISWEDLRAVSLASILAVRSIREGLPIEIGAPPQAS